MLTVLIRKEILGHILSMRFAVTFVLFILLIFASIFVTAKSHLQDVAEYQARVRANQEHLSDILAEKDKDKMRERLFWDEGPRYAFPIAPLAWLGQGLQPGHPAAINTVAWDSRVIDRGLTRNPLLGLMRTPDFVYVVAAILSLLSILFMFDAVCGEKEAGTLRLTLANAVPRHTVLLGKWIGGYLVLLIPFLVAVLGGIGYAWVTGCFDPAPDSLVRVIVLIVVACIYIAVFFNLSLFISTTTSRSATSLLICLLVWVSCIVVIPNLGPVTARILRPAPPRKSIEASKRAIDEEIELRMRRLTTTSGEVNYGSTVQRARDELERERKQRKRKLESYLLSREEAQMDLAQTLGRLSPAACWTYAAVALTNTGPDAYKKLQQARDAIGTRYSTYVEGFTTVARKTRWREWPEVHREDIPDFRVSLPDRATAIRFVLNDVLIMMILNVVFFMLGFTFFLRYDVR